MTYFNIESKMPLLQPYEKYGYIKGNKVLYDSTEERVWNCEYKGNPYSYYWHEVNLTDLNNISLDKFISYHNFTTSLPIGWVDSDRKYIYITYGKMMLEKPNF